MTVTLALGWWIAPALFTVAVWIAHWLFNRGHDRHPLGGGIVRLVTCLIATVLTLLAWLVWAVIQIA